MSTNLYQLIASLSCLILVGCNNPPSVSSRAKDDQAIGASYTGLAQQLGSVWRSGARQEFADKANLSIDDANIILRHLDRYPADDYRVAWVLLRYPHYSAEALQQDYERLQEIGVVEATGDESWRITELGIEIYNIWREVLRGRAERYDGQFQDITSDLLSVLDNVMISSALLDDGQINESIVWRINHQLRWPPDAPALLRIDERMGDQIAFQNDNAHYRINIYASAHEIDNAALLALSPLAHELYGATRRAEGYAITRCYEQSFWRVTKATCDAAMEELIAAEVVDEIDTDKYAHTLYGAALFQKIEAYVDERRYSVWSDVTHAEYDRYMEILDSLPDRIAAMGQNQP